MKRLVLISLLFLITLADSFAQRNIGGDQRLLLFDRKPSAASAALGRTNVNSMGSLSSAMFNPALLSGVNGISAQGSYSSPYYYARDGEMGFAGFGAKVHDKIKVGVSQHKFWYKIADWASDDVAAVHGRTSLILASEPFESWHVGITGNYFDFWGKETEASDLKKYWEVYRFDIGLVKEFEHLFKYDSINLSLAASMTNMTGVVQGQGSSARPQAGTLRLGTMFKHVLPNTLTNASLNILSYKLQFEYQNVLDSDFFHALKGGLQIDLMEVFQLRCGYYQIELNDWGYPDLNVSNFTDFTYGAGLKLPFSKVWSVPLDVQIDYANMPQTSFRKDRADLENFTTWTLGINVFLP